MPTAIATSWKPGMSLPYTVQLGGGRILAIDLDANWLKADPSGQPLLLPPAVRALGRLRSFLATQDRITPGFLVNLREGMGLTQAEFGQKLGVSKMTVSRWECGRMHPDPTASAALLKLQRHARHRGVLIDGEKRTSRHKANATTHAREMPRSTGRST